MMNTLLIWQCLPVLLQSGQAPAWSVVEVAAAPTLAPVAVPADRRHEIRSSDEWIVLELADLRTLVRIRRDLPALQSLKDASELLGSFGGFGKTRGLEEMPSQTREAVGRLIAQYGRPSSGLGQDTRMAVVASSVFELEVDGKRVRLPVPLEPQGESSASLRASLAQSPADRSRGTDPSVREPSRAPSTSISWSYSPDLRSNPRLPQVLLKAAEAVAKLLEIELAGLTESLSDALKGVLAANVEMFDEEPRKGRKLDELPKALQERLRDSFVGSFRSFGFDSADSAEQAWSSAVLKDAFVEAALYNAWSEPGGGTSFQGLVFATTRR